MPAKPKLTELEKLQLASRLCDKHNMVWTDKKGFYQLFRKAGHRLAWLCDPKNTDELLRRVKKFAGVSGKAVVQ